jgi:hypothetical protein
MEDRQTVIDVAKQTANTAVEAARLAAQSLAVVHTAVLNNTALTQTAIDRADATYVEANHANLKIQAVLDAGNIAAGLPLVPVTARSIDIAEGRPRP